MSLTKVAVKVALITGAGRRIGAATARALHAEGWNVVIHYRESVDEALALAAELDALRAQSAITIAADLRETAGLAMLAEAAHARWQRLDALVNNASSYFRTPWGSVGERDFDELINSNLKAPLFLAQACTPLLADSGSIVNILDVSARKPGTQFAPYLAAKAGLWTLTEALALELAPRLRVNGVAPGHMVWGSNSGTMSAAQQALELARVPLRRLGGAEEIARAVRYLLSDDAAYLTGAIIPVDGGLRLS